MVSIVDVTGDFLRGAVVDDMSWVKLQMSLFSISSLALTSKIPFINFVMMKGS